MTPKPHSTPASKAARTADDIRQMVGEIVNETEQNDEVDSIERRIGKWLNVWVEEHERLEEQYEVLSQNNHHTHANLDFCIKERESLREQFELLRGWIADEAEAGLPLPKPIRKIIEASTPAKRPS